MYITIHICMNNGFSNLDVVYNCLIYMSLYKRNKNGIIQSKSHMEIESRYLHLYISITK